jgi:hypothetical protein
MVGVMKIDNPSAATVAAKLKTIGSNPSADELLQLLASQRGAPKAALAPIAKAAVGALERTFDKAADISQPDILGVYAEDAGKLQELIRAVGTLTPAMTAKVGALLNRIVDLRVAELRDLASPISRHDAAGAIRESDNLGESLKIDLARLPRYGFPRREVDIDALTFAVKRSAVDAFVR